MKLTERAAKQKINLIRRGLINLGISLRLDIKSEEYIELLNLCSDLRLVETYLSTKDFPDSLEDNYLKDT